MSDKMWTPVQTRILELLSDGLLHSKKELQACIDEYAGPNAVNNHLTTMRKKLRPMRQEIRCIEKNGESYFEHIRVLSIAE